MSRSAARPSGSGKAYAYGVNVYYSIKTAQGCANIGERGESWEVVDILGRHRGGYRFEALYPEAPISPFVHKNQRQYTSSGPLEVP